MKSLDYFFVWVVFGLVPLSGVGQEPEIEIDLLTASTPTGAIERVYGWTGDGSFGVPVCGGHDCDGDGFPDSAFSSLFASPAFRNEAGEVALIFGDGVIGGEVDAAQNTSNVLKIIGSQPEEVTGAEVWMDDVTGDGIGDLIIGRQNHTPAAGREGAGALSILVGGPHLRQRAADGLFLDLGQDAQAAQVRIVGENAYDRMGIWMRTGDVDGDGISDVLVGMDQTDLISVVTENQGSAVLIKGGPHLATGQVIDLADMETGSLPFVTRIDAPSNGLRYHLGATVQLADLDNNGRADVCVAASLARAGAALRLPGQPTNTSQSSGGAPGGRLYIMWDDNFSAASMAAGVRFSVTNAPGTVTQIDGEAENDGFAEEILGGLDYDGDGRADLFTGDLVGDGVNGVNCGIGHVFFDAARLKGAGLVNLETGLVPSGVSVTRIDGPIPGAIGCDTASHGDFDGDGIADLAIGNPHDRPFGRVNGGSIHILYGRVGGWPTMINTAEGQWPDASELRYSVLWGAKGQAGTDAGDTLCYSASYGDMNLDGRDDLIVNEMVGNAPAGIDVGNMLLISGRTLERRTPVIREARLVGVDAELFVETNFGMTYGLEMATDLVVSNWVPVVTNIVGNGSVQWVEVPGGAAGERGFWRVGEE